MRRCLPLCAALSLLLSGCSAGAYGRELEDTVLVQVVGVDAWEKGVVLTAAGADGEEETAMETVRAGSLEEAFAALPTAGEKYFSLTNVTQIVVGDGADLREVLWYVLDDPDMSYMATVWAAGGFAGALMEETGDGGVGRFSVLEQSGGAQTTVKEALADLLGGQAAALPVLAAKDGKLETVGTLETRCFSPPEAGRNKSMR